MSITYCYECDITIDTDEDTEHEEEHLPPKVVTLELIKELRNKGLEKEAQQQLKAYHESRNKAKRQIHNEIIRKDNAIKRAFGVCTWACCKNEAAEGYSYCEDHRQKRREYNRRYSKNGND